MGDLKVRKLTQKDIENELRSFEGRFGMTSAEFFERYNRGEMGDAEDVMVWAAYYQMSLIPASKEPRVKT